MDRDSRNRFAKVLHDAARDGMEVGIRTEYDELEENDKEELRQMADTMFSEFLVYMAEPENVSMVEIRTKELAAMSELFMDGQKREDVTAMTVYMEASSAFADIEIVTKDLDDWKRFTAKPKEAVIKGVLIVKSVEPIPEERDPGDEHVPK